ncbi:MAG: diacylglycerol kinase [Syntrophotaleaceae bacterium]
MLMKPKGVVASFYCAIEGVLWSVRTQRHMLYHMLAALTLLLAALSFHISTLEFILLVLAAMLVLISELLNTALEAVVDLVSPEYHPLARRAKDVAAGGVLVACIGAAIMGYMVLAPYLFPVEKIPFPSLKRPPGELAVASILTVTILVVLIKARIGRGRPLHGGMPSGHAAFAFSIATSVVLSEVGPILALLTLTLAALLGQSRVFLKIHTSTEVLAGALLGIAVTALLYFLFG